MDTAPGFWVRLYLRWRVWRRDNALMELIARDALVRTGVCDESDSLIRCAWDRDSGHLVIIIYLAQFDHAAWSMSRHIEYYLMRQFKGLYGVSVHSVHLAVVRARAFKQIPMLKSATALRAVLRERRKTGVDTKGVTGKMIGRHAKAQEIGTEFAKTQQFGQDPGTPVRTRAGLADKVPEQARKATKTQIRDALHADEYLSVPGYEVSEVGYEEFLSSLPTDSTHSSDHLQGSESAALTPLAAASPSKPATGDSVFVAEADLIGKSHPRPITP